MLQKSLLSILVAGAVLASPVAYSQENSNSTQDTVSDEQFLSEEEKRKKADEAVLDDLRDRFKVMNENLGGLSIGGQLSSEEMERAISLGKILAEGAVRQSQEPGAIPASTEQKVEQMREYMDSIADESLASERNKVLKAIGVDPKANSNLYYFVSYSMPQALLRSYVIEAMWSGGTLVFKGIPPGKKLAEFMFEDLKELVYDKGAAASLAIDPRLFDTYAIDKVPAIVVTSDRSGSTCASGYKESWEYSEQQLSMTKCGVMDPEKYYKMYGTVTTDYALRTFAENGSTDSQRYLDALARAYQDGKRPSKNQVEFTGEWKSVLSTADIMGVKRAQQIMDEAVNQAVPDALTVDTAPSNQDSPPSQESAPPAPEYLN